MHPEPEDDKTFEETYPRYPFAELVRLAILLGRWLAMARLIRSQRHRSPAKRQRPDQRWLSPR